MYRVLEKIVTFICLASWNHLCFFSRSRSAAFPLTYKNRNFVFLRCSSEPRREMKAWAAAYGKSIFTFLAVSMSGYFWGMPPRALLKVRCCVQSGRRWKGCRFERRKYQMQASAPEISVDKEAGYERKSLWMRALSFGEEGAVEGRARRERTMMDVMEGWLIHCESTSAPIVPVLPVRMTFILEICLFYAYQGKRKRIL